MLQRIVRLDAHHRLLISMGVAGVVLATLPGSWEWPTRVVVTWIAYAGSVLVLTWTALALSHPRDLPQLSRLEDSSRVLILAFVLVAVVASLGAVLTLLGSVSEVPRLEKITHVLLAAAAVVASWLLVHTLFTLRYAHLFYGDDATRKTPPGGLNFPKEPEPDYLDFAYFAFVIGMTSQTSDVSITSRVIRRLALLHGVLSFAFNTIIIALSINTLSGLI